MVFVIVLNWNRKDDILECLTSLQDQTYSKFRIVVVDNGSVDDSVPAIKASFPDIHLIENGQNLGFAGGNNVGIHYALGKNAQYVLLLNNDTIVDTGMLENLVQVAEETPRIGALSPKIYFYDAPEHIAWAGGRLTYTTTVASHRGFGKLDQGQYNSVEQVDYVPGCAMFLSRQALLDVGMLDPTFFPAYGEDVDWCMRATNKGYKLIYVPQAKVWHRISKSSGGAYSPKAKYLSTYYEVLLVKRYATCLQKVKYLLFAGGSLPMLFLLRALQGKGSTVIAKGKGLFDGLLGRSPRRLSTTN